MLQSLVWERDGRDWPNREASRFVEAADLRWHVQQMGAGPVVLLVHGTGASTHSWRGLAPLLARRFTVIAPDLPGHGFTELPRPARLSLPGMSKALAGLLQTLGADPVIGVGHSAGAAILIRMTLDGLIAPRGIVSLNGALLPMRGVAGQTFSPMAKLLFVNPVVPHLFAGLATRRALVERIMQTTGSDLEPQGMDLYARLFRSPDHVAGALGMMANWDLHALERDMHRLTTRTILVAGENDATISPEDSLQIRYMLPTAEIERLPGLGHLAHEERPEVIADIVARLAASIDVLSPA